MTQRAEAGVCDALVVVNRHAGTVTSDLVDTVLDACAVRFSDVCQLESKAGELADQVEAVVRDATPELVVSIGGDGTVRDVAEGMARGLERWASPAGPAVSDGKGEPSLLVVPAGSGNSVYSLLWGEVAWNESLGRVLDGLAAVRRVDLIRVREADRVAVLGVNVGLVARVAQAVERVKAAGSGGESAEQRYWAAFGEVLEDLRPFPVRVTIDGEPLHDGVASLVTVGGVRSFGRGMFKLLPRSVVDDGVLDVCVVAADTPERIAQLAALVPSGAHVDQPGVRYGQGRQVTVERTDGQPLAVEHDGDPRDTASSVTLEVLPGTVPFCASEGSATERG